MRQHLIDYTEANHDHLQTVLSDNLRYRNMSLKDYIDAMKYTPTCGFDITLLILSIMFKIDILVVRSDFLWVSGEVAPNQCQIVLVQGCNGSFLGSKKIDGSHLVNVGEVPKIVVNKRKNKNSVNTSTPLTNCKSKAATLQKQMEEQLSPIIRERVNAGDLNASFDPNETSESTQILRNEVKQFEEKLACESSTTLTSSSTEKDKEKAYAEKSEINDLSEESHLKVQNIGGGSEDEEIIDPDQTVDAPETAELESEISGSKTPMTISGSLSTEYPMLASEFTNTPGSNTSLLSEAGSTVDSEMEKTEQPLHKDLKKDKDDSGHDTFMNEIDQCNINTEERSDETLPSLDLIPDTEPLSSKVTKTKSVKKTAKRMRRFRLTVKKKHKKRLGTNGPVSSIEVKELNDTNKSENVTETIPIDDKSGTEIVDASREGNRSEEKKTVCEEPEPEVGENVSISNQSNEDDTGKKEVRKSTEMRTEQQDKEAKKDEEEIIEGSQPNDANTRPQQDNNDENSAEDEEITFEPESDEDNPTASKSKEKKVKYERIYAYRYGCNKCTRMFYNADYYDAHLVTDHRIRNTLKHKPIVIKKLTTLLPDVRLEHQDCEKVFHYIGCESSFYYEDSLQYHETKCFRQPLEDRNEAAERFFRFLEEIQLEKRRKKMQERTAKAKKEKESKEKEITDKKTDMSPESERGRSRTKKSSESSNKKLKRNKSQSPKQSGGTKKKKKKSESDLEKAEIEDKELEEAKQILDKYKTKSKGKNEDTSRKRYNLRKKEVVYTEAKVDLGDKTISQDSGSEFDVKDVTKSKDSSDTIPDDSIAEEQTKEAKRKKGVTESRKEITDNDASTEKQEKSSDENAKKNTKGKNKDKIENDKDMDSNKSIPSKTNNKRPKKTEGKSVEEDTGNKDGNQKPEISDKVKQSRMSTRQKTKEESTEKETEKSEDTEQDMYLTCKVCGKTFNKHLEYRVHRQSCTKIPKKHKCPDCGKGFAQKSMMVEHHDYRHTNKPKRFVCKICNKHFELKKVFDEHNQRLHSKGDYPYLCDTCSKGFFGVQEFKLHRAKHTGIKPYKCGRCGIAAFADVNRLNNHLKHCGISSSYDCSQCGSLFTTARSLATHVSEKHQGFSKTCPFCKDKNYTSQGGYYAHLRNRHKIGRDGIKLSDALIEEISGSQNQDSSDDEEKGPKNGKEITDNESVKTGKSAKDAVISEKKKTASRRKSTQSSQKDHKAEEENNSMEIIVSKKGKLTVKCPFSTCPNVEFDTDQQYFEHLAQKHKLVRS